MRTNPNRSVEGEEPSILLHWLVEGQYST
jgi:hypothetical protein